jgi:uncharacterized protein
MGQPVAWFDVAAKDPAALRKFFADLFGWKINVVEEMNYGLVDTGSSEGIPGGIGQADDTTNPAGIVLYAAVDDAKAALDRVEALGGKTEVPPYEIPGYGVFGIFRDPEGNRVGLWQR